MIKNIMVSISGSAESLSAAKYAICLAKLFQAKLLVVYVINVKALGELLKSRIFVEAEARSYERDLNEQGRMFLERIRKMAESKGVVCDTLLLSGAISDEVIGKANQQQIDLLVVGEVKELSSRADVFYDEGERIIRKSPCPVVMAKNPAMIDALYKEII